MGQIIQSHGMHFFELAGPDLILGFDADPAIRNVVGLIGADPELTVRAVQLRKFGQDVIYQVGGRRIHPNFAVPGGVNQSLTSEKRDHMLAGIDQAQETTLIGIQIIKDWADANIADIEKFAVFDTGYFGLVTPENGLELYEGDIRLIDKDGDQLEKFSAQNYLDIISEHVENWSYLKFPYYKKMGWPDGVYRVGPLGRLNIAEKIDTPLAQKEFEIYRQINDGKPVNHTLYYHYSRLIETLFAIERTRELLNHEDLLGKDIINRKYDFQGEGVGVIEAPRGTLLHHYWAKPSGQLERVNLIVSTGHNNWAMSEAVDSVAKTYVKGPDVQEGMLNRVEAAIRAYDPCLSCSTHAVGQMPIKMDIVDAKGKIIKSLKRD
jgi:NAD-reducing hydrogenase large subunit